MNPTRRFFLRGTGSLVGSALLLDSVRPLLAQQPAPSSTPAPAARPAQPPKPPAVDSAKVQAIVGKAHRDLQAVLELIGENPFLVNACWDWGGGDFETPLEAAAHMGRRDIAELLLTHNARPSLFAAAMLGQLDLVKAHLAISPKAHEIPGPHGFTVLHCAKQGGDSAKSVVAWLLANGAPDVTHRPPKWVWPPGTQPKAK